MSVSEGAIEVELSGIRARSMDSPHITQILLLPSTRADQRRRAYYNLASASLRLQ